MKAGRAEAFTRPGTAPTRPEVRVSVKMRHSRPRPNPHRCNHGSGHRARRKSPSNRLRPSDPGPPLKRSWPPIPSTEPTRAIKLLACSQATSKSRSLFSLASAKHAQAVCAVEPEDRFPPFRAQCVQADHVPIVRQPKIVESRPEIPYIWLPIRRCVAKFLLWLELKYVGDVSQVSSLKNPADGHETTARAIYGSIMTPTPEDSRWHDDDLTSRTKPETINLRDL
jgi:hypothetical protein